MPITVTCAGCKARLSAPDVAAGKRVKCPKCGGVILVPAAEPDFEVVEEDDFEVVDDAPPAGPAARRSAPPPERPRKPVRRRDDDDDDEGDDPRPRKKGKKSAPPPGVPVWAWAVGGLAALLLVGGGVYWFVFRKPDDGSKGGAVAKGGGDKAAGPRWDRLDDPDGAFVAYFPNGPGTETNMAGLIQAQGGNPAMAENVEKMLAATGMKMRIWSRQEGPRAFLLQVLALPPAAAGGGAEAGFMAGLKGSLQQQGAKLTSESDATVGGRPGKVFVADVPAANKSSVTAVSLVGTKVYTLTVAGPPGLTADDPQVKDYIAKFEIK